MVLLEVLVVPKMERQILVEVLEQTSVGVAVLITKLVALALHTLGGNKYGAFCKTAQLAS